MFRFAMFLYAVYFLLIVAGVIGWVRNIVDVIYLFAVHAPVDTTFVVRLVGVPIAVLGAIVGWF